MKILLTLNITRSTVSGKFAGLQSAELSCNCMFVFAS